LGSEEKGQRGSKRVNAGLAYGFREKLEYSEVRRQRSLADNLCGEWKRGKITWGLV
jgi:hypothetical protein